MLRYLSFGVMRGVKVGEAEMAVSLVHWGGISTSSGFLVNVLELFCFLKRWWSSMSLLMKRRW